MNAILLILRGCPVGWLGAYGNEWVGTPHLDALAAESVVFDRHISDCPDPFAAGRAWLTGRYQILAMEATNGASAAAGEPGLLEKLRVAGIHTVLVRSCRFDNDAPVSFTDGWDEMIEAPPIVGDPSPLDALLRLLPAILDRLAGTPRFFLGIEIDRLLPPWDVPQEVFEAYIEDLDEEAESNDEAEDEYEESETAERVAPYANPSTGAFDRSNIAAWEWLHRTFAAQMTTFDAELGDLLQQFRSRGLHESATWLLTSDFGYPLGEHGQVGRFRPWLHEELVHLPLILRLQGAAESGRRVPALTQPPDVYVTILESLGIEPEAGAQGHSLLSLARGERDSIRDAAYTGLRLGDQAEWAIRTREWALLLPEATRDGAASRLPALFEKPDDRWEVNDLHSRQLEKAEELAAALRESVAALSGD